MFETLGHYKILDRIGAGGMGEVYRARDTRLGRTVAIKVLAPDVAGDPDRRARFLQDARAAAALSHPNIAALYEIGEDQDQLFLVFEYVPGRDAEERHRRPAAESATRDRSRRPDRRCARRRARRRASSTATSSPTTSSSRRRGTRRFSTSAWRRGRRAAPSASRRRRTMATRRGTTLGDGRLHVAGAGARRAGRSPHRHLLARHRAVRDADRQAAVHGATATALALQIVQAPAPAPSCDQPGAAGRARRDRRQGDGEEPRSALRVGGDAGGGAALGRRDSRRAQRHPGGGERRGAVAPVGGDRAPVGSCC